MAETPKNEPKEYSRENIAKQAEKLKQTKDIQNKRKEIGYDKNTEDGRAKLSQEWIKRANLSGAQKQRIWKELGIVTFSNAKEVDQKVKEWQKAHGLLDKKTGEPDGIIGWATLEALDKKIEEQDVKYDKQKNGGIDFNGPIQEGYGLARVDYHDKEKLKIAQFEDTMKTLKTEDVAKNPFGSGNVMAYMEGGQMTSLRNEQGEIYNKKLGVFEKPSVEIQRLDAGNALRTGKPGKFIDENGIPFEIKKDENGKISALRGNDNQNKSEQYDMVKNIWKPYADKQV